MFHLHIFRQVQAFVNEDGQGYTQQTLQGQKQPVGERQQSQAPHGSSRHERNQKSRKYVLDLLFRGIVNQVCRIIAVQEIGDERGADAAPQHIFDAVQHTQDKRADGNYLLNDFQAEEQVRTPFHLQDVQVDGMKRIEHTTETDDLQKTHSRKPFLAYQDDNQRSGHGSQSQHTSKRYQHRAFDDLAIGFTQAFRFILNRTQYRITHPLNNSSQVAGKYLVELVGARVLA